MPLGILRGTSLPAGGMVPLAATLAREDIFQAFQGDSKLQALLHGHSYTGHAVGCAAANAALSAYSDPTANRNLCSPGGGSAATCPRKPRCEGSCEMLVPLWDEATVRRISQQPGITRVTALGGFWQSLPGPSRSLLLTQSTVC